jgi:hypothetical protein
MIEALNSEQMLGFLLLSVRPRYEAIQDKFSSHARTPAFPGQGLGDMEQPEGHE